MSRRQARETALQVLFAVDLGDMAIDQAFSHVVEEFKTSVNAQAFARELVTGTLKQKQELDKLIAKLAKGWNINRLAAVDRNLIRLALYEMFYCPEIPPVVSVNEAVELAKTFGGEKSGRFVNGILGQVLENIDKFAPHGT